MSGSEFERDHANRFHVRRNVFTGLAVTTCGALHQHATLVGNAHREAVEFQFGGVFDCGIGAAGGAIPGDPDRQRIMHALVKRRHLFDGKRVVQREHRCAMDGLRKLSERCAADALGRRVRRQQFGMRSFNRLQLAEQAVVLGVRHRGRVHHIVGVVVTPDFFAQQRGACSRVHQA